MPWPKGKARGPLSPEHLAKTRRRPNPKAEVPVPIQAWLVWLRRAWRAVFGKTGPRNVAATDMVRLASLIAEHGTPSEPAAALVFNGLVTLLFSRRRLDWTRGESLRKQIEALPTGCDERRLVAHAVLVVEEFLPFPNESFSIRNFVDVVLALGDVDQVRAFVDDSLGQQNRRVYTLGAIFTNNSLAYWRKTSRRSEEIDARSASAAASNQSFLSAIKAIV